MLNPEMLDALRSRRHAWWPVVLVAGLILLVTAVAFLRGCRHGA